MLMTHSRARVIREMNGFKSNDFDVYDVNNGGCDDTCMDTINGSVICSCSSGYELAEVEVTGETQMLYCWCYNLHVEL